MNNSKMKKISNLTLKNKEIIVSVTMNKVNRLKKIVPLYVHLIKIVKTTWKKTITTTQATKTSKMTNKETKSSNRTLINKKSKGQTSQ
jgi:hypothetical protein